MVRRAGRRTDYVWSGLAAGAAVMGSITTGTAIQGIISFDLAGTLRRIRGEVQAMFTTAAAANSMKVLAVGLIMASSDAVVAGATAIPSPATDLKAPWVWHGFLLLARTATTEGQDSFMTSARLSIDSKAMRRVKPNEDLVFVMDPVDLVGTEGAQLQLAVRALIAS